MNATYEKDQLYAIEHEPGYFVLCRCEGIDGGGAALMKQIDYGTGYTSRESAERALAAKLESASSAPGTKPDPD